MKILKKIGIGFLALIICFCSCFKFVNAYDYNNYVYSSTQGGTIYHQPLINAELFMESITSQTTFYSLPLTQSVYLDLSNTNNDYTTIYSDDLEIRAQIGILKQNSGSLSILRPISVDGTENVEMESYNYTSYPYEIHYYSPFTPSNPSRCHLSFNYGLIQNRDADWSFSVLDTSNISILKVTYDIQYLEDDNTLKIFNKSVDVEKVNGRFSFNDYLIHDDTWDWQYMNSSPILQYNVSFDTSNLEITEFNYNSNIVNSNDFNNIIKLIYKSNNSFLVDNPDIDVNTDFTSWLVNAVGSFMSAELFPGFQLSTLLGVIVSIPILIYILRLFMGG